MILSDPRSLASLQRGDKFKGKGSRAKNGLYSDARKEAEGFISTIRDNIEASWKSTELWRKAALESYEFVENQQWDEKDKKILIAEGRPVLTFNRILPIVRLLSGLERQNRADMKVYPRGEGSTEGADIINQILKFVDDDNLGAYKRTRKSNDVYVTGKGYIESDISYEENLQGDPVFRRRNPLSVFEDALEEEWDGSDRRYIAVGNWMQEDEAKELWPEFADQIQIGDWLSGASMPMQPQLTGDRLEMDKLFLDQRTKRVRVFNYWYKKREVVQLAVNVATGDVKPATPQFMQSLGMLPPEERQKISVVRQKMSTIRVATLMNWLIIDDNPSPFDHGMFPVVKYIGLQYYRNSWGIVEFLKDPSRLRNKAYSQGLNHLNRSANSGWLNKKGKGADPIILEKMGSAPGVVIEYGEEEPQRIEPVALSAGHFQLTKESDAELKEISGVNAELLGLTSQTTVSGRAIDLRQRGGLTGNEDLFDNQLMGDKMLGTQLIGLIQQVYGKSPERVLQILSERALMEPGSATAEIMKDQIRRAQLPELISQTLKGEYRYVVDQGPKSVSAREARFAKLLELAKQFPGRVPPKLLIEASDLTDTDKAELLQWNAVVDGQEQAMRAAGGGGGQGGPGPGGVRRPGGPPRPLGTRAVGGQNAG